MRIRNTGTRAGDKIELQMTPMIDIVFQLLIFFIMTFKIVSLEGDFSIKMPQAAVTADPTPQLIPPIKIRLTASETGELAGIQMNDRPLTDFRELHQIVHDIVGYNTGPDSDAAMAEVELICDYNLRYENVIRAITAVSGELTETGEILRMIEKINFTTPEQPPSG